MPSFDVVSKLVIPEVDNAIIQAQKELAQRYDFKGTDTTIERKEKEVVLESSDDYKVKASWDVFQSKLIKRGISLKSLKAHDPEPAAKGRCKMRFELLDGIDTDHAKEIIKMVKEKKMKVQASIQDEQVRITGNKKDDLQQVIVWLRTLDFALPLQFINFRD